MILSWTWIWPKLGIPVAGVAKAGDEHPLQDRVHAGILGVSLLQPLSLDAQIQERGEHGAQKALFLRVLNGLRREVVLHYGEFRKTNLIERYKYY